MRPILITGKSGQVGQALSELVQNRPNFVFWGREELDLSKTVHPQPFIDLNPALIINCAAYTAVDKAETEKEDAGTINHLSVLELASVCKTLDIPFIHISSDYVYHLNKCGPLVETDECKPQGIYAKTKYAGEREALKIWSKTCIVRTSWVYGIYGHNFVKTMLRLSKDRTSLSVVNDQIGAPTFAPDLANALLKITDSLIISPDKMENYGVFNYSNEGAVSWYDFASEIFRLSNIQIQLIGISTKEFNAPAPRPLWSVMSKSKIKTVFRVQTPHWLDGLRRCLVEIPK